MKTVTQPFVSVITPVYNGEKYLEECIESVLGQTYQNWDYVIVNNCSTDRSLEIAMHYTRKDSRIHLHNNKQFVNVIQNHNHAFRQISPESKYCKVLQADDWLFRDCIMHMVKVAEENPSVGIVGSYRLEEKMVTCDGLPYPSTVVSGKEICRYSLLGGPYVFGSPTTLLIRSDLIRAHKSFYNENNLHADTEACYDILKNSDFGFVHEVLSFTRRHNETETTFARRFNTYILGDLRILQKYGPIYLSEQKYKEILIKKIKAYYGFLGKSIFLRKGQEFWSFHKNEFKKLGYPVSKLRLYKTAFIFFYNRLVNKLKI